MLLRVPLTGTNHGLRFYLVYFDYLYFGLINSFCLLVCVAAMLSRRRTRLKELPRLTVKRLPETRMQQVESFVCIVFIYYVVWDIVCFIVETC